MIGQPSGLADAESLEIVAVLARRATGEMLQRRAQGFALGWPNSAFLR